MTQFAARGDGPIKAAVPAALDADLLGVAGVGHCRLGLGDQAGLAGRARGFLLLRRV